MDKEILELLKSMQNDMKSMQNGMKSMQSEMKSMKDDMKSMQSDMKKMDSKIDKNTLRLEELNTKVGTIAEVQKSHMDQNERAHSEIIGSLSEKGNIVELAVKDISKNITEFKDKFDKVEKVTIQNTYDVAYLKSAK